MSLQDGVMEQNKPLICIVDDDQASRDLLNAYLDNAEYDIRVFPSANDFLQSTGSLNPPGCILLDNSMPGMSGLELQSMLDRKAPGLAVIFVSGLSTYDEVFTATQMGAAAFLQKPVRRDRLLEVVAEALSRSRTMLEKSSRAERYQTRYASLTEREKDVFRLLAEGKSNKQIARDLDITLRTVEFHRANILRKLDARHLADLIELARGVGLS